MPNGNEIPSPEEIFSEEELVDIPAPTDVFTEEELANIPAPDQVLPPTGAQEMFDTFFKVEPTKPKELKAPEQQVVVSDNGEVTEIRLPTPKEAEALAVPPEEAVPFRKVFAYGNELLNEEEYTQKKQQSEEITSEILPRQDPADKNYTDTFETIRTRLVEQNPENPQFVETEIKRTQKEILENDILQTFDKIADKERFVTLTAGEAENLKTAYRNRGFDDDIVEGAFQGVMESKRDDVLLEKSIAGFKEQNPDISDEEINKFMYRNAVTTAEGFFDAGDREIFELNQKLSNLLRAEEIDKEELINTQARLNELQSGRLFDPATGIRLKEPETEEQELFNEQVIAEARIFIEKPNFKDQLQDAFVKRYLAWKRTDDLWNKNFNDIKEFGRQNRAKKFR